jgi:hypothetical protein
MTKPCSNKWISLIPHLVLIVTYGDIFVDASKVDINQ